MESVPTWSKSQLRVRDSVALGSGHVSAGVVWRLHALLCSCYRTSEIILTLPCLSPPTHKIHVPFVTDGLFPSIDARYNEKGPGGGEKWVCMCM